MLTALAVTVLFGFATPPAQAFEELKAMCRAEAGRMWGHTVCGPTMLVERDSRRATVAADGEVRQVVLPETVGIANTAIDWDGRRWTMVMLPLPDGTIARRTLLAHESFHRIQKDLGLTMPEQPNAHLDTAQGRMWLRLEWRALASALASSGSDRRAAIADALAFRRERRRLAPKAAAQEQALEINEGLAEYTGSRMAVPVVSERAAALVQQLAMAEHANSYVRNFAYASGPAWGAIIEIADPWWTRRVRRSSDLGDLARTAWHISTPAASPARAARYGGEAVRAEEASRQMQSDNETAALRARLIVGPTLVLPLREMKMVFDPNAVRALEGAGTVYRTITVTDVWGKVTVTNGALMSPDFTRLTVPASADGYTLELRPGWRRVPSARSGDETLAQTPNP